MKKFMVFGFLLLSIFWGGFSVGEPVTKDSQQAALLEKIGQLQTALLERDKIFDERVQLAIEPFQVRINELAQELQMVRLTLEERKSREPSVADSGAEKSGARIERGLREQLRQVSSERDALRAGMNDRLARERDTCAQKVSDLQARLSAEQSLTSEKIRQVQKPCEERSLQLEQKLKGVEKKLSEAMARCHAR